MKNNKEFKILKDKIAGCVYGFAIGDAMGATTEFMTCSQIRESYGVLRNIVGGGWLGLKPGQVTDDTQMTMCVMRVLKILPCVDPSFGYEFKTDCTSEFLDWLSTDPEDVGTQCRKSLQFCKDNIRHLGDTGFCYYVWPDDDEFALGNGSLMRSMPCAVLGLHSFNVLQSDITHPNSAVRSAVVKYSELVWRLISGFTHNYTISELMGVQMPSELPEPTGDVYSTLGCALIWANMPTFEDCLVGAVNNGGYADTIAAVACSLAGARFGLGGIDARHVSALDKGVLQELSSFVEFAANEVYARIGNSQKQ